MTYLHFQRLDVYREALRFLKLAEEIVEDLPQSRAGLNDQLRRASNSVCLNIAEGAGEFSPKEKARFYRMAMRSAAECGSALDICRTLDLIHRDDCDRAQKSLASIITMLTKLVLSISRR